MRKTILYWIMFLIAAFSQCSFVLAASNLEEGVKNLAEQITKSMLEKQKQKIAIIDFPDLDGNITPLGRFIAEELTTQLFIIAPGKFEVVERRLLLKLEEELTLSQKGFIEEKSIKKMGQVFGVDAVVTGSLTDLGNAIKVNARMIAVESAKVFAVAAAEIPKTKAIMDLIGKPAGEKQETSKGIVQSTPQTQQTKVETLTRIEIENFTFEAKECNKLGHKVSCSVSVTNNEPKIRKLVIQAVNPGQSILVDSFGNQYPSEEVWFGGKGGRWLQNDQEIPPGVPMNIVLKYRDVNTSATNVTVIIDADALEGNTMFIDRRIKAVLRNIPLGR
ncbi:MAG: hypothetical protein HZB79_00630 [Deltaproteobacteria bacterium]|nr:hypothetical protein [Deltaproteobacteria bacterium]